MISIVYKLLADLLAAIARSQSLYLCEQGYSKTCGDSGGSGGRGGAVGSGVRTRGGVPAVARPHRLFAGAAAGGQPRAQSRLSRV